MKSSSTIVITTAFLFTVSAGPLAYGACQAGCAGIVMACYSAAGKGKQRAGELMDSDLALEICRHEIQSMVTQVSDRVLAKSIARAVDTDARVIGEAQLAEDQAARDRKFAIRLSSNPNARAGPAASNGKKAEEFVYEVEDDLIDILRLMNLANDQSLGQAESSGWAASRKPPPTR
ncbi:unnamed protein product [Fusarium graminearum]|nr:unnamed protein product [Fusarium graminearum]